MRDNKYIVSFEHESDHTPKTSNFSFESKEYPEIKSVDNEYFILDSTKVLGVIGKTNLKWIKIHNENTPKIGDEELEIAGV